MHTSMLLCYSINQFALASGMSKIYQHDKLCSLCLVEQPGKLMAPSGSGSDPEATNLISFFSQSTMCNYMSLCNWQISPHLLTFLQQSTSLKLLVRVVACRGFFSGPPCLNCCPLYTLQHVSRNSIEICRKKKNIEDHPLGPSIHDLKK